MTKQSERPLLENKVNTGIETPIDVEKDLIWKKDFNSNSWFSIGHFEVAGETIDYLYHLMQWPNPNGGRAMNEVISMINENTGEYHGEDKFYSFDEIELAEDKFLIKTPSGEMSGNADKMYIKKKTDFGSLDLVLRPVGFPIYNGGTGIFPIFGVQVHQYSIPSIQTTGLIHLGQKDYQVSGTSWFDRQWQQTGGQDMNQNTSVFNWTWLDLNLNNGDKISIWSTYNETAAKQHAWATVLKPNGSQLVVPVESLTGNVKDSWLSNASGQEYPYHYQVKIPALKADLDVLAVKKEQEINSQFIPKYEAASKVHGKYQGEKVSGYCYIELVGMFPPQEDEVSDENVATTKQKFSANSKLKDVMQDPNGKIIVEKHLAEFSKKPPMRMLENHSLGQIKDMIPVPEGKAVFAEILKELEDL